jgi:two-component system sensor histidine kinase BaeS
MPVDPLHVEPALAAARSYQIDDRVVGPFRLDPDEHAAQRQTADSVRACLQQHGSAARTADAPSGRVVLTSDAPRMAQVKCGAENLWPATHTERLAMKDLSDRVNTCLSEQGGGQVKLSLDVPPPDAYSVAMADPDPGHQNVRGCLAAGRRAQLVPFVAPPALLFVRGPTTTGTVRTSFSVSTANLGRVAGVAVLVLVFTIAVTVLVGARLVRPLRALTAAAQQPSARVPVSGRDEIGALAAVLNRMSERRERAEQQRTAMVRDVAHELRTPLANIRSWLEAAEDGLAGPLTDPDLTGALLAEALQLQHIIDDLQDLAAADGGTLRLDRQPVALDDLARRAVTGHRGGAEAAGVRLLLRLDDPLTVTVDPVRIAQALGNLITNAVRYTPAGGTVTARAFADDGVAVLTVSDTGPGIAADDLPHVFDRFWRADPSRTRDTGGSGLGLAIVRQIVEAHEGTVSAASVPGHGATFTVRLP